MLPILVSNLSEPKQESQLIVLGGCGTSGRVAFQVARAANAVLCKYNAPPCFRYVHAGGDAALVASDEIPEDNPHLGANALLAATGDSKKSLFVGVTCGFSAAYVAGAADAALARPQSFYPPVVIGFNPVELARNAPVSNWTRTCRDVFLEVDTVGLVINPILGPEALAGSSRLKGGTATRVILDMAITRAIALAAFHCGLSPREAPSLEMLLVESEAMVRLATLDESALGSLVTATGQALRTRGHVYFVGADHLGVVALVDVSEMPDTFGAPFDEIRAFVVGGWAALGNVEGDLSPKEGPKGIFRLDSQHFMADISPGSSDIVVLLVHEGAGDKKDLTACAEIAASKGASVWWMSFDQMPIPTRNDAQNNICINLGQSLQLGLTWQQKVELAAKVVLNIITTGAQIRRGAAFSNRLICMTLANSKIFDRGVRLISECTGCSPEQARTAALRAVYETDTVDLDPDADPILAASQKPNALPLGILLASCTDLSVQRAISLLQEEPVVRDALLRAGAALR